MSNEIIDRQEAMAKGLDRYRTGLRCKNGHRAERYVLCCRCVVCVGADEVADDDKATEAVIISALPAFEFKAPDDLLMMAYGWFRRGSA